MRPAEREALLRRADPALVFFVSVAVLVVGVFLAATSNNLGCWSTSVPVQDYRYCKRIGFTAYDAKADTAYWSRYGMQP